MAPKLDKDLKRIAQFREGTRSVGAQALRLGLAILFLALVALAANALVGFDGAWGIVVIAAVVAGYMALNIGANDVANNMSPAVGSRTLTIGTAVVIAAFFEAAGAIIAGGDVVTTISSGIISPAGMDAEAFVTAMLAALFAAALWVNLATWVGAPVSTTHAVVGGVLGGGIVLSGFGVADWSVMLRIVASWVISPVLGGVIAASFLAYIQRSIRNAPDRLAAARLRVPILTGLMAGVFATYLMMKAMSRLWPVSLWTALVIGAIVGVIVWLLVRPSIARQLARAEDEKVGLGALFTIPVIGGAALLSFAHGSNDVANAIGPLAAIFAAVEGGQIGGEAALPLWVLLIGALGIAAGLLLYGPRLIRTVGSKITKLNRVRAFCITLSAAITVIVASALGLPVSSTHIAIGALFGVGFLREQQANNARRERLNGTPAEGLGAAALEELQRSADKQRRRYLVRRSHLITIVMAWVITVPATALLSAGLALLISATGMATFS